MCVVRDTNSKRGGGEGNLLSLDRNKLFWHCPVSIRNETVRELTEWRTTYKWSWWDAVPRKTHHATFIWCIFQLAASREWPQIGSSIEFVSHQWRLIPRDICALETVYRNFRKEFLAVPPGNVITRRFGVAQHEGKNFTGTGGAVVVWFNHISKWVEDNWSPRPSIGDLLIIRSDEPLWTVSISQFFMDIKSIGPVGNVDFNSKKGWLPLKLPSPT